MSQPRDHAGLLGALQALYHKLVNQITVLRLDRYRPHASSSASEALVTQLRDYINRGPKAGPGPAPDTISKNDPPGVSAPAHTHSGTGRAPTAQPNSFSESLSERHASNSLNNSAGEKLVHSAWDHLHASIRHSRDGNRQAARLHAGIMESALKEAAHYMDAQAYQEFAAQLGEELSRQAQIN